MADTLSREERSVRMSAIRGRNTKIEREIRRALTSAGFRYRLDVRKLPGRPDIVLARHRAVIFVHGCFWHRHANCSVASNPRSNRAFWREKFAVNVRRDRRVQRELRAMGWRVLVVWECSLGNRTRRERRIRRLLADLTT
ncbi:MAG: very short patch repair endonuclease [Burkholderiales bacterium]